jgi:hypothetical protein
VDLVFSIALRAGLLLYCLIVPGWALLRVAGFSSVSKLDRILACVSAGAAATSLTVTTLLLVGLYYRPLTIILLLVPLAYLLWSYRTPAPIDSVNSDEPHALPARPIDQVDRAVLVAAAGFLAVYLLDAWTSPITWWDGLASWGKWAADWGRRSSSAHYVVAGYPQLVPRLVSVMYKITGAYSDVLPLDFFALHGFYVLFAAWFVLGAIRLTQLLDLPAWPVILAGLGSVQFREHSAAGTVDVLVCALVTTLLALYFGLRRGSWTARRESLVLGSAAFALIFTKWTGAVGLVLMLLLDRASQRAYPLASERSAALTRSVRRAAGIAVIAVLPFVIEQGISELRIGRWQSDPYEVNISLRQMPTLLSTDANVVYRGGDTSVRARLVQLRFWNSYDVPASLRVVFTTLLVLCLVAAAWSWFGRAALPLLLLYGAIWLSWSSYDQRNVFGVLPVLALCASFGAARLWQLTPGVVWKNGVALLAGLFVLLAGSGMLKDAQSRLAGLARGDRALPARLDAMRGTVPDKVARFYPHLVGDYRFISALAERSGATHVLVTTPLFRFFERGAHAMSLWPYEQVQPGDVFASHEWLVPPDDPRWVLVARGTTHRVWLRVAQLLTVTPRIEDVNVDGSRGLRRELYSVERADLGNEGFIVWQATMKGDTGKGAATFRRMDALSLDTRLVSTVCEGPDGRRHDYRCSGIVALTPESLRAYQTGQLEVGVSTDAQPGNVTLSVAQPLQAPDGPR